MLGSTTTSESVADTTQASMFSHEDNQQLSLSSNDPWDGDGILLVNEKGHISYANSAAEKMFLAPPSGLKGRKFGLPLHDGMSQVDVHPAGKRHAKAIMYCSLVPRKKKVEYLVTIRSLGHLRKELSDPGIRGELLQKVFAHSPIGIIVVNLSGRITVWNNAATRILGWSAQELIGNEIPTTSEEVDESLSDIWRRTISGEVLTAYQLPNQKRADGHPIDLQLWTVLISNKKGMPGGAMLMVADLTPQKKIKEHLRRIIRHDPLTGLANRKQFRNQLARTIDKVKANVDAHIIVMALGIDRFKAFNKSLGYADGDSLLQQIAHRLTETLYEIDVVSRTGGDEFSILLRDTGHIREGTRVSEKLLQVIREPFQVDGREFFLTASIGIAVYPSDGLSASALLRAADSAMDRSKESGGDRYQYFAKEIDESVRQQLLLEQELHQAITKKQFYIDYQPQWNLQTGQMVGVEALLRWRHPELNLVPPSTFIPIAESSGLIISIGAMVLREACRQVAEWNARHDQCLSLAVNVSLRQFQSPSLLNDVVEALECSGIAPECLELEITESVMATRIDDVTAVLQELKRLGVRIAIDDFGTGYSSLSYLANLPIDTLKIDRSFIAALPEHIGAQAIVTSVLVLVQGLNLRVVAEGIETDEQLEILKAAGCHEGQGYLMGKPSSPECLTKLMDSSPPFVRLGTGPANSLAHHATELIEAQEPTFNND